MTNGDKIRNMSDEELVNRLYSHYADVELLPAKFCYEMASEYCNSECEICFLNWLKQEVTDD